MGYAKMPGPNLLNPLDTLSWTTQLSVQRPTSISRLSTPKLHSFSYGGVSALVPSFSPGPVAPCCWASRKALQILTISYLLLTWNPKCVNCAKSVQTQVVCERIVSILDTKSGCGKGSHPPGVSPFSKGLFLLEAGE